MTRFLTLVGLLLALGTVPCQAQPAKNASTPDPVESGEEANQDPATESEPPEPAPAGLPEPDPANTDSPFDYQASEQISEDLPVSFPVDI